MSRRIFSFLLFMALVLLNTGLLFAQVDMADELMTSGKIYTVIAVLLVIFAGLIALMISSELKLNKLEKLIEDKEKK